MAHRSSQSRPAHQGNVPSGLLNVDKPRGITSRAVVDRVQQVTGIAKVGHAGTLDPMASGVLVVALGTCTRLIQFVQQLPKQYRAEFLLGRESNTEDITGTVTELRNPPKPSLERILQAAAALTGRIQQRPPAFSALKVRGKRAYELARQGKPVELRPRQVEVYRLRVVAYDYPVLELDIECSGGTYVRSLGRDLAEHAGTTAVMSRLVRTGIGNFTLEEATGLDELSTHTWQQYLLGPIRAVEHLPAIELSAEESRRIAQGQTVRRPNTPRAVLLAALGPSGNLVAILRSDSAGRLRPVRNLSSER